MTQRPIHAGRRPGLTLLEVLVALAIFLFAMVVMGGLITTAGDQALEVQYQSQAGQLCQTKLAEVNAGVVPLESQSDVSFDEDPDWQWSLSCEQDGSVNGLWNVHITVSRERADHTRFETTVSQLLIDPQIRGSSLDAATPSGSDTSTAASATSGSSSTPASGGAAATPATGGAAKSTSGGSSKPTNKSTTGGQQNTSATPPKVNTPTTPPKVNTPATPPKVNTPATPPKVNTPTNRGT